MNNFNEIIEKIEAHTGKKFDYNNRRHRLRLSSAVNLIIDEGKRVRRSVREVFEGMDTYDATRYNLHKRRDIID